MLFDSIQFKNNDFHKAAFLELVQAEVSFTNADLEHIIGLLSRNQLTHSEYGMEILNIVVPKTAKITKNLAASLANKISSTSTYQQVFTNSDSTAPVALPSYAYTQHLSQKDFQYICFSDRNGTINTLWMNKRLDEEDVAIRNIILNYLSTLPESNQHTTLTNHINAELAYYQRKANATSV